MKKLFQKILTFILALITGLSAPVGISDEAVVSSQQLNTDIFTYTVSDSGVIVTEIAPQSPPADIIIPEYIDGLPVLGIEASALIICDDPSDRYALSVYPREDIKSITVPYSCDILNIGIYGEYAYWPLPLIKCKKQSPAHQTLYRYEKRYEIIDDDGTEDYIWLDWYIDKDGNAHVMGLRGSSDRTDYYDHFSPVDDIVLPNELEGCPVVSVGGFYGDFSLVNTNGMHDIKSMALPDTVEVIRSYAFYYMANLGVLHGGNGLKRIEEDAIYDAGPYTLILGKNVEFIDENAFDDLIEREIICYENSYAHRRALAINEQAPLLRVKFIDESHLTSNVAKIDKDGNVKGLPSGITKDTAIDFLAVDGDATMEISDDVIGTGTEIKLINIEYGTVDNTYTVIMDGDLNGDGSVNTTDDVNAIRKIITGNDSAFSEAHKKAADLNGDGLVNSTDLVLMKSIQN